MKIKLDRDYILLSGDSIGWLGRLCDDYTNVKQSMYEKALKDWDCNNCGKKTKNNQEYCDKCIDDGVEFND